MPFVNVKLIEGVFTPEQKQQIVRDLTDAMVAIEGENMRQVTWVVVEEVHSGDWGVAGNPLSTAEVKALAAGAPVGESLDQWRPRHRVGGEQVEVGFRVAVPGERPDLIEAAPAAEGTEQLEGVSGAGCGPAARSPTGSRPAHVGQPIRRREPQRTGGRRRHHTLGTRAGTSHLCTPRAASAAGAGDRTDRRRTGSGYGVPNRWRNSRNR